MFKRFISNIIKKILNYPSYRKLNLYVVDDIDYYCKLVKINLEQVGYNNIEVFYNGEDVINKLKYDNPDCIILDHILSDNGLNGNDVLSYITINNPNIKVIILSGQENIEVAANMIKQGAYDYIIKNDLAFFNLKNTLYRLEDSVNQKEKTEWMDKRIKSLYLILIILIWIISLIFIF